MSRRIKARTCARATRSRLRVNSMPIKIYDHMPAVKNMMSIYLPHTSNSCHLESSMKVKSSSNKLLDKNQVKIVKK